MDIFLAQAFAIARRMWKYRWYGLLVAWVAGVVGAVVVFMMPDRYEASARIYVDTQSILKPLMSGLAVQGNIDQQVAMLSRTLISRPNVEKLVRMSDLDLKNQTKAEQDAMIDRVGSALSISSAGRDNLYTLSYRDNDPDTAKRVVQNLTSIFVESSLGSNSTDAKTATTFINEQIKTYEAKLEDAETRLKEFRLHHINMIAGEGKDAASHLGELSDQLEQARMGLREAVSARDAAKAQLQGGVVHGPDATTASLLQQSSAAISTPEIDARIDAQQRNLDGLLQRYTEAHPEVIATRKLIADLQAQKRKEEIELRKQAMAAPQISGIGSGGSMVQQEVGRLVATTEVQVATMRARVDELSSHYQEALNTIKSTPEVEAEASQLNRDYAVNKKNYEDLVARRESAAISGDLNDVSGVADFRVIDPARASPKPVAPNRLLLLVGVLGLAVVGGLFSSFVACQLRPVFHDAGELRLRTELPVLGVVTKLLGDAERRRERLDLIRFTIASGSFVGVFAVGLTVMAIVMSKQVS